MNQISSSAAVTSSPALDAKGEPVRFLVHDARNFADRNRTEPLTPEKVREYLPGAEKWIDWEGKSFLFPVRATVSGATLEWAPSPTLEEGRKGGAMVVFLAHALLAAGFQGGNAYYEPSVISSGDKSLVWRHPYGGDLVTFFLEGAIGEVFTAKQVLFHLSSEVKEEESARRRSHMLAKTALKAALRRHFGGDEIPVFADAPRPSGSYCYCGNMGPRDFCGDHLGTLSEVRRLPVAEVAARFLQEPVVLIWLSAENQIQSFGDEDFAWKKTVGLLAYEGAYLTQHRKQCGVTVFKKGC